MRRLFFAITLPEDARDALATAQRALQAAAGTQGIRWTAATHWHLTLKFLGDTPEESLAPVRRVGRSVASCCPPFTLTLSELGAFPNTRRPQILWLGVESPFPVLARLAQLLDSDLERLGFAAETRPFQPHCTLARIPTAQGQRSAEKALFSEERIRNSVDKLYTFEVDSFVLMQSDLRPEGAIYTALETFPLTGV